MSTAFAAAAPATAPSAWRRQLTTLAGVSAAILLLFARDAADMAGIWWNSSTYNHCLLIPPLIAWLVWQRRPELLRLTPRVWLPGLILVGLGGFAWLLGYAASVGFARHAGLVVILQGVVVTLLGKAVSRGLLFPLAYALFLIPFGDEAVPAMQTVTAEIAMALLDAAGMPAHLEGVFITTAAGYFEVAEACAGVKFLIAMVALGALVANVCFRSWKRRALFMAAAIVVPILANGVRAFATIYVADSAGLEYAAGFDHVVYGGIFFAIVIALILGAAWPFFDRKVGDPWFEPARLQPGPVAADPPRRLWRAAGLTAAIACAPLLWESVVAASGAQAVSRFEMPEVPGWTRVSASGRPWQPVFAGADHLRVARYRDAGGREVDLAIVFFARQEEGRELLGFGQGAAGPGWAWTADAPAPPNGRAERIVSHGEVREVVSYYVVGDILTGNMVGAKLEMMKVRLIGGPQRAAAILVSAPETATGASPRPAIDRFVAALGPLDRLADGHPR
ncbi:MAG: exosortase A [Allosphingosinicella sp.]|uniref:exosortase A n=1 Tax=Allosphingosinicella sp. TaxID=2823234 RepID=UPI003960054E